MYSKFSEYIKEHGLLQKDSKVLLAVSGGIDSMVMTELFRARGTAFSLAHCNFQLRGRDSFKDQAFVESEAGRLGVKFHTASFETEVFARKNKISVQMAARELRYRWLEKTRAEYGFDLIATAHHLDDSIETMLLNLLRGTGLAGLKGIPRRSGNIIRPLLFASRDEIEQFAQRGDILYREDQTNKETKYQRNKLRHEVIPKLEEINPGLRESMRAFFERMESTTEVLDMVKEEKASEIVSSHGKEIHLDIAGLERGGNAGPLIYMFLQDYGFSAAVCLEILSCLGSQPGKRFFSPTHTAIKDREKLIIFPSESETDSQEEIFARHGETEVFSGKQRFTIEYGIVTEKTRLPSGPHTLMADMNKLKFPLLIRRWKAGDKMIPLGMKGMKKVSDILTEAKLPLHRKKEVLVLESGGKIAWLAGIRADERFRITSQTREYVLVKLC